MAPEKNGLKVLLLEDDINDIEIIQQLLTDEFDCRISFESAETKEKYIRCLENNRYDIILADYTLPGFNAEEALQYVHTVCPDMPFICVSGTIGEDIAVELIKKGADDYVLKDRLGRLPFAISRALISKEREETISQLTLADKNKSTFFNVLSHELRNPLATISAGLELLDISNDSQQKEKTKRILRRQVEHLCRLVDDLMDVVRITNSKVELKKDKIELNKLIRLVSDESKHFFEQKGIMFRVGADGSALFIDADPSRLRQMITNLLNNALKFTPPGGEVSLSTNREENEALICVEDNGAGIGPEFLPLIFEPFIQAGNTPERDGGLGLGLAITRAIAELHGGRINVESEGSGKGARFLIHLPLLEENAENECRDSDFSADSKKRILLIEDDKDYAEVLSS